MSFDKARGSESMNNFNHIEIVSDDMVELLRQKTPLERLRMAHTMWQMARKRIYFSLRDQHADWSADQLTQEVAKRLLGKDFPE